MVAVSAVECRSYAFAEVDAAVTTALDRIGFDLPRGGTVLLKPNVMSQNRPGQHTVTHPAVVAALCGLLSDNGCRVQIGDSEAFFERGMTRRAFHTTGLDRVAARFGATLVPFEEQPLVACPTGLPRLPTLYLPRAVLDADVVVNVPKLKSHSGLRLSGALKNLFGCVPGGYKQAIHRWSANDFELSDAILAIHRIVRPALTVMDAVVGLDGGPAAIGRGVRTGRVLASTSAAALDLVASRMIGYDPAEVSTLQRAVASGMIAGYDDADLLGTIESLTFSRLVRGPIPAGRDGDGGLFVTATFVQPRVTRRCNGCDACLPACPVGAIRRDGGRATINEATCLTCYHCLTLCPQDAIGFHSSPLNKVVRGVRTLTGL